MLGLEFGGVQVVTGLLAGRRRGDAGDVRGAWRSHGGLSCLEEWIDWGGRVESLASRVRSESRLKFSP